MRFLIDTGANKNFINPIHIHPKRIEKIPPVKVKTIFKEHQINDAVTFKGLMEFRTKEPIEFLLFKFHEYFDGLIGLETLQKFSAKLDFQKSILELPNVSIPLKFSNITTKVYTIEPRSKQIFNIPVDKTQGEIYIKPIKIQENLIIAEGLYTAYNGYSLMEIINFSNEIKQFVIEKPVKSEKVQTHYNIEINHLLIPSIEKDVRPISELIRISHLNPEEKEQILKLCNSFKNLFQQETERLTFTNQVKHEINLSNEKPSFVKSYRYPEIHKEEVNSQISKMLEQGIIRPSYSPWSSPIWIVPKKADASGKVKWRLVVDYRKLNEQTIDDRYPLPNITEILDKLGKCMYFTTLDLASGFHQIEVEPKDIPKTAFTVDYGHYEYVRMPFGLKNAPSTFQRVMDNVLKELQGKTCLCYMDDIIIFSTSLQEHMQNLRKVFERLQQANLKIQLDKSEFLHREIAFLGHIITTDGVKPNPDKIKAIQNFPIPKTEKQIKSFLGLLGYYRKFIKDFANITKPLTACLRKNEKIILDEKYIKCFEYCKTLLIEDPILQYPDFSKQFILTTDASNVALGAVLSQGTIGQDKPICYASRTLTVTEQNYSTIEKELLAIVWACKYFRPYLFGRKFQIITDHKPLTWLFSLKEPNSKLIRWRLKLEEFDYEINYKKGSKNTNADALSRITPENEINTNSVDETLSSKDSQDDIRSEIKNLRQESIPTAECSINEFNKQIILEFDSNRTQLDVQFKILHTKKRRWTIRHRDFNDTILRQIFNDYIQPNTLTGLMCNSAISTQINRLYRLEFSNSNLKLVKSNLLLKDIEDKIEQKHLILNYHHQNNHRGISETVSHLKRNMYFPNMKNIVNAIANKCEVCQTMKYNRNQQKIKFEKTEDPSRPFQIVHIDIYAINNKTYLTILDKFSKFAQALPLLKREKQDVIKQFQVYISHHGIPDKIVSDNGVEFISKTFKEYCMLNNIKIHYTCAKNSTGNSPVERFHSTLTEIYRVIYSKDSKKDSDQIMSECIITYNNAIHSTTKYTPFELIHGHINQNTPFNYQVDFTSKQEYVEHHKKNYDKLLNLIKQRNSRIKDIVLNKENPQRTKPPDYTEGQTVYIKDNRRNKLARKFTKEQVTKNNKITIFTKRGKAHKNKIKHVLQVADSINKRTDNN